MTPCFICGTPMDEINVDPRDLKPAPCSECQSVITQTVEEMGMDETSEIETLDEDFDYDDRDFDYDIDADLDLFRD